MCKAHDGCPFGRICDGGVTVAQLRSASAVHASQCSHRACFAVLPPHIFRSAHSENLWFSSFTGFALYSLASVQNICKHIFAQVLVRALLIAFAYIRSWIVDSWSSFAARRMSKLLLLANAHYITSVHFFNYFWHILANCFCSGINIVYLLVHWG